LPEPPGLPPPFGRGAPCEFGEFGDFGDFAAAFGAAFDSAATSLALGFSDFGLVGFSAFSDFAGFVAKYAATSSVVLAVRTCSKTTLNSSRARLPVDFFSVPK
jgi:hypothetical protein